MSHLPPGGARQDLHPGGKRHAARMWALRFLPLGVGLLLFWLAFRSISASEIRRTLALIQPWQLVVIVAINILFHILMGTRWWFLARRDTPRVRLREIVLVRLGAFGVSYLTPGPQLGGEPLQVLYLRRRHAASYARATSTVIMDRLVELLGGFIFMVLGIASLLHERLLQNVVAVPPGLLMPLALLVAWPAAHIFLLWRGTYPISTVLDRIAPTQPLRRTWRLARAAEHLAGRFCQRRPGAVLAGLAVTLAAASLSVTEYALITSFLDMGLSPWQIMSGWTAGWLSFLVPVPGALGALEASQIIALGSFGISRSTALSAVLLLRARDLLFGGVGFLLATRQLQSAIRPL